MKLIWHLQLSNFLLDFFAVCKALLLTASVK